MTQGEPIQRIERLTTARPAHVLLASSPYSGSTLASHLLGIHPQVATVSDVSGRRREQRMATFTCSCGRRMVDCPFWERVLDGMRAAGYPGFELGNFGLGFDHWPDARLNRLRVGSLRWRALETFRDALYRRWPADERAMQAIGRRNVQFAATVAAIEGGRVFVDASKERLRARYLRRYVDPDLRVIHLVRDVRGVVASARGHATHARSSVDGLARDWARTNEAIARAADRSEPGGYLLVRYEDLCREPERVLSAMYEFCGVEPLDGPPPVAELHLLGNRVRLASLDEIRLDERWRETLGPDEQARILAVAGPTFTRLYGGTSS